MDVDLEVLDVEVLTEVLVLVDVEEVLVDREVLVELLVEEVDVVAAPAAGWKLICASPVEI